MRPKRKKHRNLSILKRLIQFRAAYMTHRLLDSTDEAIDRAYNVLIPEKCPEVEQTFYLVKVICTR